MCLIFLVLYKSKLTKIDSYDMHSVRRYTRVIQFNIIIYCMDVHVGMVVSLLILMNDLSPQVPHSPLPPQKPHPPTLHPLSHQTQPEDKN